MTAKSDDLGSLSMLELFRAEVDSHAAHLSAGLLHLETGAPSSDSIASMMRAAHSIKGAARIVGVDAAVGLAHAMEDCFVAAQQGRLALGQSEVDVLLEGLDLLKQVSLQGPDAIAPQAIERLIARLTACVRTGTATAPTESTSMAAPASPLPPTTPAPQHPPAPSAPATSTAPMPPPEAKAAASTTHSAAASPDEKHRAIRVSVGHMELLMSLAGEALVQTRWLRSFADSLLRIQLERHQLTTMLSRLQEAFAEGTQRRAADLLDEAQQWSARFGETMAKQVQDFDLAQRRLSLTTQRLYRQTLTSRMRPFSDGVQGFPRMVRDLARSLGKEVRFAIAGQETPVDRDVLDRLEAPLTHLIRNALDHGLEPPDERERLGKTRHGVLDLAARHVAGVLSIVVADDGRGVDLDHVRRRILAQGLASEGMAATMSASELLEFLFLPGFSTRDRVTELSGRGVGLDVVRNMLHEVGGTIHMDTESGHGTRFELRLPLTLSVMRCLLFQVANEPYALPLRRIDRCLKLPPDAVKQIEESEYVVVDGENIGLVAMAQVLELDSPPSEADEIAIVVIGQRSGRFGFQVERFLGERDLVVRPLDSRLGKTPDVAAASITEDGSPLIILDADDLVHSAQLLLSEGRLGKIAPEQEARQAVQAQRILVVDDSITVREVERRLLENHGYEVDVAVDGTEGWRAVRAAPYELVITDVDMPRLDGIELTRLIRSDMKLKDLPILIVSYKDSESDRRRGLEAGASYYMAKSSFHDDRLLSAVIDLIGQGRR